MTMNVTNDPASLTVRPAPWLRELAGETETDEAKEEKKL